jgi:integrase
VTYVRMTGLTEGPTKNHTSRTVPVPVFLARLLETEVQGHDDTALVFPSARGGGFLTLGQARYAFQKATRVVDGCDGVRLPRLEADVRLAGNQCRCQREGGAEAPGHKTAVLTLDRYGHLLPDDLDAVAETHSTRLRNLLRTLCGR